MGVPRRTPEVLDLGKKLLAGKGKVNVIERARRLGVASASVTYYMRISEKFGDKLPRDRSLAIDLGALAALAHPAVSEEVRLEAVARARQGERITRAVAEEMLLAGTGK